jgi:biotin-dependent carboxylase-like uncharacterized protein
MNTRIASPTGLLATGPMPTCAVAGARFALRVDGEPVPVDRAFVLRAGQRLRFGERQGGARAALAIAGGIEVPAVYGSRATGVAAKMGPFGGRPLKAGDVLPIGSDAGAVPIAATTLRLPAGGARVRVILGPHEDMFMPDALDTLTSGRFVVTTSSNRMGYRLEGPVLKHAQRADILSDATPIGSIQVPAAGQPILLMADRQTTGGYPRIATVISADVPIAGQLAPGDWIEFKVVSRSAAIEALREQRTRLEPQR